MDTFPLINNSILPKKKHKAYVRMKKEPAYHLAVLNKERFYFTGRPCLRGHICKRYVEGMKCYECCVINRIENKNKIKLRQIRRTFNLSEKEYNDLILKQKSLCAICQNKLKFDKHTHVDHCKETKKVRGILCHWCNVGIGHFKHKSELLRKAALYCEAE